MVRKKGLTVSISTWFCLPDQGMKDMEILCRATAFAVSSSSAVHANKMHFVTASHSIAPWKFRNLYPEEWLQAIDEKNTFYTIESRHKDGSFLSQSELLMKTFHHKESDLAVLHLEKDHEMLFDTLEVEPHVLTDRELVEGDDLLIDGFEIDENSPKPDYDDKEEVDVRRPVPTSVPATFIAQYMFLKYASANQPLGSCMSGAPVTCKTKSEAVIVKGRFASASGGSPRKTEVCGMIGTVVPEDSDDVALRGLAAFVGADTIQQ